jgi:hypothetical protein
MKKRLLTLVILIVSNLLYSNGIFPIDSNLVFPRFTPKGTVEITIPQMDVINIKLIEAKRLPSCDSTVASLESVIDTVNRWNGLITDLLINEQKRSNKLDTLLIVERQDKKDVITEYKKEGKKQRVKNAITVPIVAVVSTGIGVVIGILIKTLTP